MKQLTLPDVTPDYREFRHELEWAGWTIVVKMLDDPQRNEFPYEWTLVRNRGRERLADPSSHRSLDAAIAQAKAAILTYEEGYVNR